MGAKIRSRLGAITTAPEVNAANFTSLINFSWAMLQPPYTSGWPRSRMSKRLARFLQATLGDALLMGLAHGKVALATRDRH